MSAAAGRKVLLIRDRDFFLHVYQLADLLTGAGHRVTVLNTCSREPEPLYQDLIDKARGLGVRCFLVRDSSRPSIVRARVSNLLARLGIGLKSRVITKAKIEGSRSLLGGEEFDVVVAYDPASLFLACRLFPKSLHKIVDYSIEVIEEHHPHFQTDETVRSFVHFERKVLPRLKALLIQDPFRARLLLRAVPGRLPARVIHFPVSVPGPVTRTKRPGLYDDILGGNERVRILFFGGLWWPSLMDGLRAVSAGLADDEVLIAHGGRGQVDDSPIATPKWVLLREPIKFDQLDQLIASADIGLVLYPENEPNSRYTAYASEKIARYTKAGLPFVAFANEDYEHLRATTGCCVLVESFQDVPAAIRQIRADYQQYRANAFAAFERIYDIGVASRELLDFIETA